MLNLRRPSGGRHLRSTRRPVLVAAGVVALLTISSTAFAVWTAGGSGKAAARTAHWTGTEDPRGPVTAPTNPVTGTRPADTTAPTTTDDTAVIGDAWSRTERTVTLRPADPGGSGVAATYFTTDDSTPTIASSQGTSVRLGEGVHVIRYFSTDRAGNRETIETAATPIRVDGTAPSAATLDPLPEIVHHGQVLSGGGDDALSGVARVVYELCAETACDAWTPIGSRTVGPGFPLVWRDQPSDGSYQVRANVLDAAGNATASAPRTVRVENSRPIVTVTGRDDRTVEAGDTLTVEMSESIDPSSLPFAASLTFSRSSGRATTMEIPGLTDGPVDTGTTAWVAEGAAVTYSGTLALSDHARRVRFTVEACQSGCDDAVAGDAGVPRSAPAASLRDP
jgi:hypothetical protein